MALRPTPTMLQGRYLWNGGPPPSPLPGESEYYESGSVVLEASEDNEIFDRRSGKDVLGMISRVAKYFGYIQSKDLLRIEVMIAHRLPNDVRTHGETFHWLIAHLD